MRGRCAASRFCRARESVTQRSMCHSPARRLEPLIERGKILDDSAQAFEHGHVAALDGHRDRNAVGWARERTESTNEEGHEGVGGQADRAGVVTDFLEEGAPERPERGARDLRMRTG